MARRHAAAAGVAASVACALVLLTAQRAVPGLAQPVEELTLNLAPVGARGQGASARTRLASTPIQTVGEQAKHVRWCNFSKVSFLSDLTMLLQIDHRPRMWHAGWSRQELSLHIDARDIRMSGRWRQPAAGTRLRSV